MDVDWRVDDNGRGPKIREHIVLGAERASGPPGDRRDVDLRRPGEGVVQRRGRSAPAGRQLDDPGEAPAGDALYVDNRGSPWSLAHTSCGSCSAASG